MENKISIIYKIINKSLNKRSKRINKSLNKSEIKALEYLIKNKGYSEDDIFYTSNNSPDYIISHNNSGYEVKRKIGRSIYFGEKQLNKLKSMLNTEILVFDDDNDIPISVFSSLELSNNKIIDNIKIKIINGRKDEKQLIEE